MRLLALILTLVLLAIAPARAEKRIALVIGNQRYGADVGPLTNPQNDVDLVERALKTIGFEVTTVKDAGLASLYQAVNAYVRRLQAAGPGAVGFFYYSGHGAANEDNGADYLIPVDVPSVDTGELWDRSIRLSDITSKLKTEAGNATHFVVVDACRNKLKLRKPRSKAVAQAKGFRPVPGESGMLIAFATAEGELSSDEGDGAGPYSRVLAEEIVKPNVEAVAVFRRVQVRVRQAIGQEPWLGFNALGEVFLAGPPSSNAGSNTGPSAGEAERAWSVTQNTTSQAVLESFIKRYGDSFYGDLARARLGALKKGQVAVVAPPIPASSARPGQEGVNSVFKTILVSRSLGEVGVEEPADMAKNDWDRESERDYIGAILRFLKTIEDVGRENNVQGGSSGVQGDVTQDAVDQAVSQAYERKKFATFEQFVGEQWTSERLRVSILDHASTKLPGLLLGNNRGRVTMVQIKEIINQSADAIYEQTLETSELIAVNQATARLTRALFESRGPSTDSNLRVVVEDMLSTASKAALADFQERFLRSGELGIIMRYRAERILVDCLTANIKGIITGDDKVAGKDEMQQNARMLATRGECRKWVEAGVGDSKQNDPNADEQMLKPYPVRAVWIAAGEPKTDASMYRQ